MQEYTAEFWIALKALGRLPFTNAKEPTELLMEEERKIKEL